MNISDFCFIVKTRIAIAKVTNSFADGVLNTKVMCSPWDLCFYAQHSRLTENQNSTYLPKYKASDYIHIYIYTTRLLSAKGKKLILDQRIFTSIKGISPQKYIKLTGPNKLGQGKSGIYMDF